MKLIIIVGVCSRFIKTVRTIVNESKGLTVNVCSSNLQKWQSHDSLASVRLTCPDPRWGFRWSRKWPWRPL